jgi:hypothetical protein
MDGVGGPRGLPADTYFSAKEQSMTRVPGNQKETKILSGLDNQEIAAALSGDTDGNAIDRDDYDIPDCVKVVVGASADLDDADDELVIQLEDAADDGDGSPDTWADTDDSVTITDSDAPGVVVSEIDIRGYRRHVRAYLDASESTLDAATDVHVDFVFSGMSEIPQD